MGTGTDTDGNDASAQAGPLATVLSVRPDEVASVRRMGLAAFVLGIALVMFYGGANAIFLTSYDIGVLPWVYIVNAGLVIVVGLLYGIASQHSSTSTALVGSTVVTALSAFGLWLWAAISKGDAVAFALAAWYRLLFIFAILSLWEAISAAFDIRQGKRLFPAVGLGVMTAFVVGGVLTPLITAVVGATHLILISAIFFTIYAVVYVRLVRVEGITSAGHGSAPAGPREILASSYSLLLAAMRSVVILLLFLTEFVFYEQASATFGDEKALAGFLGIFIAGSTLAMVVVSAVVAARYIAHMGMRVGLITPPVVVGAAAVVTALYGSFIGVDNGFFALVIATNLLAIVVMNSIETPVGAVTFQPLPADQRMSVRLAVDGWLGSFAVLLAGVLLLLFEAANFASVVPFVWLLVVVSLGGVGVAVKLHGGYAASLRDATTQAFGSTGSVGQLLTRLAHEPVGVGGTGLGAMVAGDIDEELPMIVSLLHHPDPAIASLAVASLDLDARHDDLAPLGEAIGGAAERRDLPDDARAHALRVLGRIDAGAAAAVASDDPGDFDRAPQWAAAALGAVLTHDPRDQIAHQTVVALAESADPADRVTAARVAAATSGPALVATNTGLLTDADPMVASAAVRAFGGRLTPGLATAVIDAGRSMHGRRAALDALRQSPDALDSIEETFDSLPVDYQAALVGQVYPALTRRPPILHRFVEPHRPSQLREAGFAAISQTGIVAPATVGRMCNDDIELARCLAAAHRDLGPDFPELKQALSSEFRLARASIFAALAIDHDPARLGDIRLLVDGEASDNRANGVEALDVLLPTDLRRKVVPVIEPVTLSEAVGLLTGLAAEAATAEWLERLSTDARVTDWTRQTAAHYLSELSESSELTNPEQDTKLLSRTSATDLTMADVIRRISALRGVDIFSTLSYPLLADLAELVTEVDFASGDVVITEGAVEHDMFALIDGQVVVSSSANSTPDVTLSAGTVFGELAVLNPAPRSATVTASTPCTALRVQRETLLGLADRHPEVMVEIASVLAQRLQ